MKNQSKVCSVCKTAKPLTDYYANCKSKDGRLARCKQCHSEVMKKRRSRQKIQYIPADPNTSKVCLKCKVKKTAGDFKPDTTTADKLSPWCIDCTRANRLDWYHNKGGKELCSKKAKDHYEKNRSRIRNRAKERHTNLRYQALKAYSHTQEPSCTCCGESEIKFLGIDHINGGGKKHRQEIGASNVYYWAKTNNYPPGFQVLCHNCNLAKGFYGACPHQKS